MRPRVRAAAAMFAAGVCLATTAATTAPAATPRVSTIAMTTITLTAPADANGAWIVAEQAGPYHASSERPIARAQFRNGKAVMRVPTASTRRMGFHFDDSPRQHWWKYGPTNENAVIFVAIRYRGQSVGSPVSTSEATSARTGALCWAGTRQSRITIPLKVRQAKKTKDFTGPPGRYTDLAVWVSPTLPHVGTMIEVYGGTLAISNILDCWY